MYDYLYDVQAFATGYTSQLKSVVLLKFTVARFVNKDEYNTASTLDPIGDLITTHYCTSLTVPSALTPFKLILVTNRTTAGSSG